MVFEGGPEPCYPSVRPLSESDSANPNFKAKEASSDKEWLEFIANGGGGDAADSKQQQKDRYRPADPDIVDSLESYPALSKHILRAPDMIVTSSCDYTIRTFDCRKNYAQCQIFEGHFGMVNEAKAYRGTQIISVADDCTIRLWQRGTSEYGELLTTFYINHYPIKTVVPLPGQRAMCGGLDQIFRIVSLVSGHTLMRFTDHQDYGPDDGFMQKEGCGAIWCCVHIKENIVASGSDDSTIRLWDIDKGKCLGTYVGHKGYGEDIGPGGRDYKLSREMAAVWKLINLGDDGKSLVSCSYDRTITIWDVSDFKNIKIVRNWLAADNAVLSLAVVAPGIISSCGADKEMKIWRADTGELLHRVRTERGIPACVQYLDHHLLALCGGDSTIRIINWEDQPKDLMGKNGFNAHEYIISDCNPIYFDDEDDKYWTEKPIMYCNVRKELGENDAQSCIDLHRNTLQEALTFEETY